MNKKTILAYVLIGIVVILFFKSNQVTPEEMAKEKAWKEQVARTEEENKRIKLKKSQKATLIIFALTFVFMIIGFIPWEDFGVNLFVNLQESLESIPVIGGLFNGFIPLGQWYFQ